MTKDNVISTVEDYLHKTSILRLIVLSKLEEMYVGMNFPF